ncbi:unnamed protein product [Triticum turgidum subsp. durum]|uniref:Uncharacterized protein n=1 Tax=Triticum turgidum subsp. durum TaxID=4567 RepID=A0A9R0XNI3_TRITD|nr:unnamed protein product [Triticum turgidum subsp. durum]
MARSAEPVAGSRSSSPSRLLLRRRQAAEMCKARATAPARGRREVRRDSAWSSQARHGRAPPHRGVTTAANIGAQIASTEPRRGIRWACGFVFNRRAHARKSAARDDLLLRWRLAVGRHHGQLPGHQGNRTTPSYVAFTDTKRVTSNAAKNQVAMNPTNTVFGSPRLSIQDGV